MTIAVDLGCKATKPSNQIKTLFQDEDQSFIPLGIKSKIRVGNSIHFLFDFILYVPSTIFQLNRDGSSWVEPVLS